MTAPSLGWIGLVFLSASIGPFAQAIFDTHLIPATLRLPPRQAPNQRDRSGPMFEQYTEDARRVLFFARLAVFEYGGTRIQPEHLLLGVLQGAPEAVARFMAGDWSVERLRQRLIDTLSPAEKIPESVQIPFARTAVEVLERTSGEANALASSEIRPEHLLLALLSDEASSTGSLLREVGITRARIEGFLQQR